MKTPMSLSLKRQRCDWPVRKAATSDVVVSSRTPTNTAVDETTRLNSNDT